jgi:hypothetical protein
MIIPIMLNAASLLTQCILYIIIKYMINMKQNKHSIKQILIASLCMVSALTFGVGPGNLAQPLLGVPGQHDTLGVGPGNLAQPLLGVPGQHDTLGVGPGNLAQPLLAGAHDGLPVQPPAQVGMGIQQPITITASMLNGLAKTLELPPNTTMQELYQHHLIPLFSPLFLSSDYNFPSSKLIREPKPGCPSCCDRYVAIIDNTEHPIRWYVKREDIHNLNTLFNENNQKIADQSNQSIINLSHNTTLLPYRHDMLISDALPIANNNTVQILVSIIDENMGEDMVRSVNNDVRRAETVFLARIHNNSRCVNCLESMCYQPCYAPPSECVLISVPICLCCSSYIFWFWLIS